MAPSTGLELGKQLYEDGFDQLWKLDPRLRHHDSGFALKHECEEVMSMARTLARLGRQCVDTHRVYGKMSPYTPREAVFTVRAYHAVRMANEEPSLVGPASLARVCTAYSHLPS